MSITKKTKKLTSKACEICRRKFKPTRTWQRHCSGRCRKAAFDARVRKQLRRLEEIDSKGAA